MNDKKWCPFNDDVCNDKCALFNLGQCAFVAIASNIGHYLERIANNTTNVDCISDSIDEVKELLDERL